jgi:hypothetical protein
MILLSRPDQGDDRLTNIAESKNTNVTFRSAQKCNAEEKITLNVNRLVVNPCLPEKLHILLGPKN